MGHVSVGSGLPELTPVVLYIVLLVHPPYLKGDSSFFLSDTGSVSVEGFEVVLRKSVRLSTRLSKGLSIRPCTRPSTR